MYVNPKEINQPPQNSPKSVEKHNPTSSSSATKVNHG